MRDENGQTVAAPPEIYLPQLRKKDEEFHRMIEGQRSAWATSPFYYIWAALHLYAEVERKEKAGIPITVIMPFVINSMAKLERDWNECFDGGPPKGPEDYSPYRYLTELKFNNDVTLFALELPELKDEVVNLIWQIEQIYTQEIENMTKRSCGGCWGPLGWIRSDCSFCKNARESIGSIKGTLGQLEKTVLAPESDLSKKYPEVGPQIRATEIISSFTIIGVKSVLFSILPGKIDELRKLCAAKRKGCPEPELKKYLVKPPKSAQEMFGGFLPAPDARMLATYTPDDAAKLYVLSFVISIIIMLVFVAMGKKISYSPPRPNCYGSNCGGGYSIS